MNECEITLQLPQDDKLESTRNTIKLDGYILKHDGENIPIISDTSDTLWYHGSSICKHICKFKNADEALTKYVDESHVKLLEDIDCNVDNYEMESLNTSDKFITEIGVYVLLLKSSHNDISYFKTFIASQILPQINKTGNFISNNNSAGELSEELIKYKAHLLSIEKIKLDIRWQENELKLIAARKEKLERFVSLIENKDQLDIEKLMVFLEKGY